VEFRLLGPIEVLRNGSPVALGGAKARALLALLVLRANEVVSRDVLIEALWPARPPGTAGHSLDVQISRLRKALEPEEVLQTRSGGYVLEVDPEQIDVHRFERLLEQGRRQNAAGKYSEARTTLEAALALWRGAPLADLAYEDFARTEIERLEELRLVATEERIEAELVLGRHQTLVPELERLTAQHRLRERVRAQLMLALYRSGRQAEALRVYADTRRRLVEDVGIEPGQQLRELERAILRQDPALDLPRPTLATRPRAVVGALALAVAAGVTAGVVAITQGGTETARALAAADSNVLLNARSGEIAREVPVRNTELMRFGAGSLWSVSAEGELVRVDPRTGDVIATIGLGVEPSGIAFGEDSVWVTGRHSPTLLRIDPSINDIVDRFSLPMDGVETDLTGEVAVGAGSVWIGHGAFNPGAWVERVDPNTGRIQKRFSILAGDVDHLAFGGGGLWVASTPSGELRKIDPTTNQVVLTRTLESDLCCVAVGGGYVWAATNPSGDIWKLTHDGRLRPTIKLASPVEHLTYADGVLWATLGASGTVARIDPTTNAIRRYDIGHFVTGVDAQDGLVAVGVRESAEDAIAGLGRDIVWIGRKEGTLFDSGAATDPAFTAPTWDAPQMQFHYATCARLLNYADAEGNAGKKLVPEVAADLPERSDGGRSYTFHIRTGFRFSPPSEEEVTAASFRHAIERALSPKFDYVAPEALNIAGVQEYRAGRAAHIAGISAQGNRLAIRLLKPAPEFPWLAAQTCAVPRDTPVVPHGVETPVASAGPFYLAEHAESYAVLRRNPNYGGTRPAHLDAIVVKFNVAPGQAASEIENGKLDYFLESQNATLRPDTAAAQAAGGRYHLTPSPTARVQFFAFNIERPLFADVRTRRAVQYALDRVALAQAGDAVGIPATRLLSYGVIGYDATPLYPLRGNVRQARELAGGRHRRAVVYTWDDPPYTDAFNRLLAEQLATIGIRATVLRIDQAKGFELAKAQRADLIWGGLNANTADPGAYLQPLSYLPPKYSNEIGRIQKLYSPTRERAAARLARRIDRESLFAVYATDAMPELVSRRLGCLVHHPVYAGADLATLCLRDGHG
jgi:DNA-binding SARP family transcriptional activator/ABC-type oligopeptide transport system substrate-binding subunit/streptogramin lyase